MIMPTGVATFSEAMRAGCEVYAALGKVIKKKYGQDAVNVGDEGGFAPNISGAEEGLDLLMTAIAQAGYEGKVKIAMDVAASGACAAPWQRGGPSSLHRGGVCSRMAAAHVVATHSLLPAPPPSHPPPPARPQPHRVLC
jgi:hypothetical protein